LSSLSNDFSSLIYFILTRKKLPFGLTNRLYWFDKPTFGLASPIEIARRANLLKQVASGDENPNPLAGRSRSQ